jgi:2-polyprenyl-6-hydroxyphenyl methylase/3-demethylubiquinone-9 3-methyltransferase
MDSIDLKSVNSHFEFGANWKSYARTIDGERERLSFADLEKLAGGRLDSRSFLDIGCGSGLSSLSAARLGISRLYAIDIDPDSVSTTRELLESRDVRVPKSITVDSVFDLTPDRVGKFDVVYSWGVLHHTGSMWEAIDKACALVADSGQFMLAIYLRTPFCGMWRWEKRLYTASPAPVKWIIERSYLLLSVLRKLLTGRNPFAYAREYARNRGMSWIHDIRDWVGGYPYESASTEAIVSFVEARGFRLERSFGTTPDFGLFGTHCGEWSFRKT